MPPSPWLSARITSTTYFSDTTTISAQKISDSTPSTASGVTVRPWAGLRHSLKAYSGLVPMSPNTTPNAARVKAARLLEWAGAQAGANVEDMDSILLAVL